MKTLSSPVVKIIDPLHDPRWDLFVDNHPSGCIYARSIWIRVIAETYTHIRPGAVAIEDDEGRIIAALPYCIVSSPLTGTRVVSLPFTPYCDPLFDEAQDVGVLLDGILMVMHERRATYYELRTFKSQANVSEERLKIHDYHKTHLLRLDDGFEKISRSFHRDCIKRSVKKAVKSGVTVREGRTKQDFADFYVMHAKTRKRLGLPIQPYRLFDKMWRSMYPEYLTLLMAELNSIPIGGLILFKYRDTVSLEHITSLEQYLPVRPNHLLLHNAIEQACNQSYRVFDFGKTLPENKGLLDFKRRWGAGLYSVPYFYYPDVHGLMSFEQEDMKQKILIFVGRHMPLPMARMMGRLVYNHLG